MKPLFSFPLIPRLEKFTRNSGFRWFVVFLVLTILVLAASLFNVYNAVEYVENLLLDLRLNFRASQLVPSDQIVVLAKDNRSAQYVRNHPELGIIAQAPLPRKRVAQMINYIAAQGPKAIVLDVEMMDASTPENDEPLEKAIQNAGNVYMAMNIQNTMPTFQPEKRSALAIQESLKQIIIPALYQRNKIYSYLFKAPKVSSFYGLYAPMFSPSYSLSSSGEQEKPSSLVLKSRQRFNEVLNIFFFQKEDDYPGFIHAIPNSFMGFVLPGSGSGYDDKLPLLGANLDETLDHLQEKQCTVQDYAQVFAKDPEFLSLLNQRKTPFLFHSEDLNEKAFLRKITYCRCDPVLDRFMKVVKGIGVVNVDYFKEGFLRDVPLLYRGYQGNMYTYLGARPTLDFLGVNQLAFDNNAIQFQHQEDPLRNDNVPNENANNRINHPTLETIKSISSYSPPRVIINWRAPQNAFPVILKRFDYERLYHEELNYLAEQQKACAPLNYPEVQGFTGLEAENGFTHLLGKGVESVRDVLMPNAPSLSWLPGGRNEGCLTHQEDCDTLAPFSWAYPPTFTKMYDRESLKDLHGLLFLKQLLQEKQLNEKHLNETGPPTLLNPNQILGFGGYDSWVLEKAIDQTVENKIIQSIETKKNLTQSDHLLGDGQLYRNISAIDVIRLAEIQEQAAQQKRSEGFKPKDSIDNDLLAEPLMSMYKLYGQPQSGIFSFKDKVVVYGDTIRDIHRTPMSPEIFGPEIVATVIDMLWHDKTFIVHINDWRIYSVVGLFCSFMAFSVIAPGRTLWMGNLIGLLMISGYWTFNFFSFWLLGWWLPLIIPTGLFFLILLLSNIYRYWVQDREKRQLTVVFANYVSPQILGEILKSPEHAMENLKGQKKELTVLFSDIKNFTATFENEEPEKMVEQLNEYFDCMFNIILSHGGTHDKYMGDAIMAIFGSPYPLKNQAEVACRAALAMNKALKRLNEKWVSEGKMPLAHGVGLSCGGMFVGNLGSERNKNYTVMGSVVNLGARLEAYTRDVDADIIISELTYQRLLETAPSGFVCRDLGKINIKGFTESVQIYALDDVTEF
ncbi:MAG: CHASE2 domain-containing protein [Cyanobacteria bacterium]|nr:CHASE2 domain-containing protein [Cyanobacteriota bacterium]